MNLNTLGTSLYESEVPQTITVNSTGAFVVQERDGTDVLRVDTDNNRIYITGALNVSGTTTFGGITVSGLSGMLKASVGTIVGSCTTDDLPEGSFLYYTDARARAALSAGSGSLTYNSGTGVFDTVQDIRTTASPLFKGLSVAVFAPTFSALTTDGLVKSTAAGVIGNATIGDGLSYTSPTLSANYNTTNMKITATQLNTIQDIATTASPTFAGLTIDACVFNTDGSSRLEIRPAADEILLGTNAAAGANTHVKTLSTYSHIYSYNGGYKSVYIGGVDYTTALSIDSTGDVRINAANNKLVVSNNAAVSASSSGNAMFGMNMYKIFTTGAGEQYRGMFTAVLGYAGIECAWGGWMNFFTSADATTADASLGSLTPRMKIAPNGIVYFDNCNTTSRPTSTSSGEGGGAISWNYSAGSTELCLWNTYNRDEAAAGGFSFKQKLTGGTHRDLLYVDSTGIVSIPSGGQFYTKLGGGVSGTIHHAMLTTGGTLRWGMGLHTVETGSNVGADFKLWTYSDAGSYLGNPFTITRSSGAMDCVGPINLSTTQKLTMGTVETISRNSGTGDTTYTVNGGAHYFAGGNVVASSGVMYCKDGNGLLLQHDGSHGYIRTITGELNLGSNGGTKLTIATDGLISTYSSLEVGRLGTGDRAAFVDFHSSGTAGANDYSSRILRDSGANGSLSFIHTGVGAVYHQNLNAADMSFLTSNTERFKILAAGGANFTCPDTNGNLGIKITGFGSAKGWGITMDSTSNDTDGLEYIQFRNSTGGTQLGSIRRNNGLGGLEFRNNSDRRLKSEIQSLDDAKCLDTIVSCTPRSFKWTSTNTPSIGFIADELQQQIPHAITGQPNAVNADGSPDYQSIHAIPIIATLVGSVRALMAQIDTLKTRITVLEST
jgi:hypothetical protein